MDGADFSLPGQEAVDVIDVNGVVAGPLRRADSPDLPIPAHGVMIAGEVWRVPALPAV
jgi:hypothetical protein